MTMLTENWNETKQALCEGKDLVTNFDGSVNLRKKANLETVLETSRRVLLGESASAGATSAANVATFNKLILPVLRRVMPTVIANEIIGVQPITAPVAQITTLRVRYADNAGGVTAGTEALSPYHIAASYSGNGNPASAAGMNTASGEGWGGNRISIQTVKETVSAKTRKLQARWTQEAAHDMQAMNGIDLEAELMSVLAQEITTEIDQEILQSLRRLPGQPTAVYDQGNVSGTATFVGDEHAALATQINLEANLIAKRTRRGPANWAVVSTTALTILQSATTSAFARTTEGTFEAPVNTKYVGTLNNSLRVYVDSYASDDTPVLIGYKGKNEFDAAAFYCPYVPLTAVGPIIDPQTFEPVISFSTRYGYLELTNTANSFGNSADYLGLVGINTANLKFL